MLMKCLLFSADQVELLHTAYTLHTVHYIYFFSIRARKWITIHSSLSVTVCVSVCVFFIPFLMNVTKKKHQKWWFFLCNIHIYREKKLSLAFILTSYFAQFGTKNHFEYITAFKFKKSDRTTMHEKRVKRECISKNSRNREQMRKYLHLL